jgi:hypothetical protein
VPKNGTQTPAFQTATKGHNTMKTLLIASVAVSLSWPSLAQSDGQRTYIINGTQYSVTFADPVTTPRGKVAKSIVVQLDRDGEPTAHRWIACELETAQGWTEIACPLDVKKERHETR